MQLHQPVYLSVDWVTTFSCVTSVPSKKLLHWANVCFSEHEYL